MVEPKVEKVIYIITNKTVFNDGFSLDEIALNVKDNLNGKYANGAAMIFYSDERSTDPSLMILCGDLKRVGNIEKFGVITRKGQAIGDDGNIYSVLTIMSSSGTSKYKVAQGTDEDKLPIPSFIGCYDGLLFSDSEFVLSSTFSSTGSFKGGIDFTSSSDGWQMVETENTAGLHKGVVEKIENDRLYLTDG